MDEENKIIYDPKKYNYRCPKCGRDVLIIFDNRYQGKNVISAIVCPVMRAPFCGYVGEPKDFMRTK